MVEGLKLLPEREDGKFWSLNGNLSCVDSRFLCYLSSLQIFKMQNHSNPMRLSESVEGLVVCLFSFLVLFFSRTCVKALQNCAFIL